MSAMLPVQRRFLIIEQGIGTALINVVINGIVAGLIFQQFETVPLWGWTSIADDTLGTTFLLLLCLIATPLARRDVRKGRIPPLERQRARHWYFRWLPASARLRAVVLGCICLLTLGPLTILGFTLLSVSSLPFWPFIAYKSLFAGLLGPLVGTWAIVRFTDE